MAKQKTKKIDGLTVLDHEGGNRFFHKHLSPKARKKKRAKRKMTKRSRKR